MTIRRTSLRPSPRSRSPIGIRLHDSLVHNLLQLLILQIIPNHHLEHQEELAIANQPIAIHIIHLEGKAQFLLPRSLRAEGGETSDELLEIDGSASIVVKDCDHAEGEGVVCYCGNLEELITIN